MRTSGGPCEQVGFALVLDGLIWGIGGVFALDRGIRWLNSPDDSFLGFGGLVRIGAPVIIATAVGLIVIGLAFGWLAFRMMRGRQAIGWGIVLLVAALGVGYALNLGDPGSLPLWELVLWPCAAAAHILAVVGAVRELRSRDATVAPGP